MIVSAVGEKGVFNRIHNRSMVKIDFIVRKESDFRRSEFLRRRPIDLEGQPLWIVSPEDLILSKLDWAKDSFSEMQLNDVKNLLESVVPLDMNYTEKWVGDLGLSEVYKKSKP